MKRIYFTAPPNTDTGLQVIFGVISALIFDTGSLLLQYTNCIKLGGIMAIIGGIMITGLFIYLHLLDNY